MAKQLKLKVGDCYKYLPSGVIYKLFLLEKRYAHSNTGELSPNVLVAFFDTALTHGERVKIQARYMDKTQWQHLGTLSQKRNASGRMVDVFSEGSCAA
jgi:hypothetical protein